MGPHRDGQAEWLPSTWSAPTLAWVYRLSNQGNAGVVGTSEFVVVSGRDAIDKHDLFVCLDTETGQRYWEFSYPASGNLDYGNSPRAAALIDESYVYTLGAFGDLNCLEIETGNLIWKRHLVKDFAGVQPKWGYAASPMMVNGMLIVQPGGNGNSMIALDAKTGDVRWSHRGRDTAYASPVLLDRNGQQTIIGFDSLSLGGWDAATGMRLWEQLPKKGSDFNVPCPVLIDNHLVVSSENNSTRLFELAKQGRSLPNQIAQFEALAGDTHTPVRWLDWIAGVDDELVVVDPKNGLNVVATFADDALESNVCLIACGDRMLVSNEMGDVLMLQLTDGRVRELGRFQVQSTPTKSLAYPAMIGKTFIYRTHNSVVAYQW